MVYRQFENDCVIRLERGEEIISSLLAFASQSGITAGQITGIGACSCATIGLFKIKEQKYYSQQLTQEMELTSLVGNLSTKDGKPYLHVHANFGLQDGSVKGGHLNEAIISATCEIIVHIISGTVDRFCDDQTGLNLLKL